MADRSRNERVLLYILPFAVFVLLGYLFLLPSWQSYQRAHDAHQEVSQTYSQAKNQGQPISATEAGYLAHALPDRYDPTAVATYMESVARQHNYQFVSSTYATKPVVQSGVKTYLHTAQLVGSTTDGFALLTDLLSVSDRDKLAPAILAKKDTFLFGLDDVQLTYVGNDQMRIVLSFHTWTL